MQITEIHNMCILNTCNKTILALERLYNRENGTREHPSLATLIVRHFLHRHAHIHTHPFPLCMKERKLIRVQTLLNHISTWETQNVHFPLSKYNIYDSTVSNMQENVWKGLINACSINVCSIFFSSYDMTMKLHKSRREL